eukprot:553066-Rhodomonas_salina.1
MVLCARYAMRSAEIAYGEQAAVLLTPLSPVCDPISLRASYAMSGTLIAYAPISLRASYEMSSSDRGSYAMCLRGCYAVCGTEIASAARTASVCTPLSSLARAHRARAGGGGRVTGAKHGQVNGKEQGGREKGERNVATEGEPACGCRSGGFKALA